MSTTVTYKGNTIATVDNNTKTLETEGKYLEADVVLTDVSGGTPNLQVKTVTPSEASQNIRPDSGYDGLSVVNVTPVDGTLLENLDSDFNASNIKNGVTMFGVTGTYEGSGGGGGGETVDITITDRMKGATVIYPHSASWSGWTTISNGREGTLTIPTYSLFIITAPFGPVYTMTATGVTKTQISQAGRNVTPAVFYFNVGTTDGSVVYNLPQPGV